MHARIRPHTNHSQELPVLGGEHPPGPVLDHELRNAIDALVRIDGHQVRVMMSCSRTSDGFYPGATTEDVPLRHDADGRPFGRHDDRKPVRPRGHGFRGLEHRTLRRHREELRLHDVFRVEDHPSVVTTTPVVSFAGRDLQTAEASSPSMAGFPEFIRKLPEADTALRGVTLWLLQGRTASATLFQAREDSTVPEHSHGAQWGIVVEGEMHLTIDKATRTCRRGDEYFVPAGVPHSASFKAGFRAIDFFDDPNRYRPRK